MKLKVNETTFEVKVSDEGIFSTPIPGGFETAKSLAELRRKLKDVTTDLNVPCTKVEGRYRDDDLEITHGTVTGVHASNRNYLVRWDDDSTSQERNYSHSILRRLTDKEVAEVTKLHAAKKVAMEAFDDFLEGRAFEIPIKEEQPT